MTAVGQLRHQTAYNLLIFRRNPAATFFTVVLPLVFFFLLIGIFGDGVDENGERIATSFVPGLLALQITSATLVNLAMTITARRERGVLKRVRGTPLRPWVFIAAQAAASLVISLASAALLIGLGWLVHDVPVRAAGAGPLLVTLVIGPVTLAALGLALSSAIPSEQAAPAITNAVVLPLYFISDVFIVADKPRLVEIIAELFPIQHLVDALAASFDPLAHGGRFPVGHWLVLTAWGLFGAVAALVSFRWMPRR
jgi:ABC-2 type transport system permease protein